MLEKIWFTARWFTGYLYDMMILVGTVASTCWVFDKMYGMNPMQSLGCPRSVIDHPFIQLSVIVAVFSAMMSGRQWARTQYFTHVLPEVWTDAIRSVIKKAHDEEKENNDG